MTTDNSENIVYYKQLYICDKCGCETTYVRSFKKNLLSQQMHVCKKCFKKLNKQPPFFKTFFTRTFPIMILIAVIWYIVAVATGVPEHEIVIQLFRFAFIATATTGISYIIHLLRK